MRREARPRGRFDAEPAHQRLRAVMAGADGDARVIQYGGDVVRMHPVDVEADDSGAVLRAIEGDAGNAPKALSGIR